MTVNLDYPVTLEPDTNGTVLVRCPDVPELHTFGEDEPEALLRAVDALESALSFYTDDGCALPPASPPKRGQRLVRPGPQVAIKLAVYQALREDGVRKSELARRLGWHMPQVDRLLDLDHASRLDQVQMALAALGRELTIGVRARGQAA
jgi:antitoxin HicB